MRQYHDAVHYRGYQDLARDLGLRLRREGWEAVELVASVGSGASSGALALGLAASGLVLGLYCLVMVLPALLLCLARMALGERASRPLSSVRELAVRTAPDAVAWGLGIVGVILLLRGLGQLW